MTTEEEVSWRGCSMQEIYRNLNEFELKHVPSVRPSDAHTVLYYYPIKNFDEPPKPLKGYGKWDALHVRLPCSSKSQYPVTKSDGTVLIESRWEMIEQALLRPINNSRELEEAILSYNSKYQSIWKFKALHKLFEEELDEDETNAFFQQLLPKIIRLALRLPELIQTAIPLLKQGQNRSVSLSQQQVSCLLANAFLCTYPRRNTLKKKSEYSSFPDINFNRLFQSTGPQVIEKIKAICHYFSRVCRKTPLGVVTMTRRSMTESELPKWSECPALLGVTPLHISSCGTIEDQGRGLLQVDFANKYLGGGVLGAGCVQEEIRFVICPELIVSKLFTEALRPNEALVMVGCEQFSKYTGYASTFTWDGNYEDSTPFDESRRRQCHIVAIDALFFVQSSHQYQEELMLRELNKAYVGFFHTLETPAPAVASGNWGCGAFGGEAKLKALLQLMACTVTKRPLVYFTFGNVELRDGIHDIHTFFIENNVTVKDLWSYLRKFRERKISPTELYTFICHIHRDSKKDKNLVANSLQAILPKIAARGNQVVNNKDDKSDAKFTTAPSQETDETYKKIIQKEIDECQDLFAGMSSSPELLDDKCDEEFQNNVKELKKSPSLLLMVGKSDSANNLVNDKRKLSKFAKADAKQKFCDGGIKKDHTNKKTAEKSELRQRSLLEMLDVCYTGSPVKRHCFSGKKQNS